MLFCLDVAPIRNSDIHTDLNRKLSILYSEIIKENIELDALFQCNSYESETVQGIFELILETVISKKGIHENLKSGVSDKPCEIEALEAE